MMQLSRLNIFDNISPHSLKIIKEKGVLKSFNKGDIIIKENEPVNHLYIVYSGEVEIYKERENRKILLNRLKNGQFFGEMALLTGDLSSAYVIASQNSKLWLISKDIFEEIIKRDVNLSIYFNKVLCYRLKKNSEDLMQQTLKLITLNYSLEHRIRERTRELIKRNKAFKSIMDNIPQAIFTISPDFKINPEYSQYVKNIYEIENIEGKNFLDILFKEDNEKRKEWENWLKLAFDPHERWENIKNFIPNSEVKYIHYKIKKLGDQETVQTSIKYLSLNFKRIEDKGKIVSLMVITSDVTEKVRLQQELLNKEQEIKESIKHFAFISKIDPVMFECFISEAEDLLVSIQRNIKILKKSEEESIKNINKLKILQEIARNIHTIKGNSSFIGLKDISDMAHEIEDVLEDIKFSFDKIKREWLIKFLEKLNKLEINLNKAKDIYKNLLKEKELSSVPSTIQDVKIRLSLSQLNDMEENLKKLLDRHYSLESWEPLKREVIVSWLSIRKVSISDLLRKITKMAKDLAKQMKKNIEVKIFGENILVERHIYENLGEILIQLIRNAVDHGIESPQKREALGKSKVGHIIIKFWEEEDFLHLIVQDDGKGINKEEVLEKALKRGILTENEVKNLSESQILMCIFHSGLSTARKITNISGRGIGLDVVNAILKKLGGKIILNTIPNKETSFHLIFPKYSKLSFK